MAGESGSGIVGKQIPATVVGVDPPGSESSLSASGPELTLIQLLPSSTVADGVRLKTGFGVAESAMPGGTPYPLGPPQPSATLHVGGTRAPLQYRLTMAGFTVRLDAA